MGKAVRFFMKDVLRLIVDTDKAARLKVQKAVDKREALNESLTKIKDEIYSRYDEKAKSLIKEESDYKLWQEEALFSQRVISKYGNNDINLKSKFLTSSLKISKISILTS